MPVFVVVGDSIKADNPIEAVKAFCEIGDYEPDDGERFWVYDEDGNEIIVRTKIHSQGYSIVED